VITSTYTALLERSELADNLKVRYIGEKTAQPLPPTSRNDYCLRYCSGLPMSLPNFGGKHEEETHHTKKDQGFGGEKRTNMKGLLVE
jgi:hypothetical protein